jgi:hypothetical protein
MDCIKEEGGEEEFVFGSFNPGEVDQIRVGGERRQRSASQCTRVAQGADLCEVGFMVVLDADVIPTCLECAKVCMLVGMFISLN